MRILASFADNSILQVEQTPSSGVPTIINGKYVIDVPEGTTVEVDADSYVLNGIGNVDAGSVVTDVMDNLLELYPGFDNLEFNYLITDDHVALLDLTAVFSDGVGTFTTRAQSGRSSAPVGLAANSVAVLPQNSTTTPSRPGVLVTDTIDISATVPGGTAAFRVWWKIYDFTTSEDVLSDYGDGIGDNTPAIRSILEVDQEPSDLAVYISNDDGASYEPVERLSAVSLCDPGEEIRLAFVNTGTTKIYLAAYAILF